MNDSKLPTILIGPVLSSTTSDYWNIVIEMFIIILIFLRC